MFPEELLVMNAARRAPGKHRISDLLPAAGAVDEKRGGIAEIAALRAFVVDRSAFGASCKMCHNP
jgi:hypothetical protein